MRRRRFTALVLIMALLLTFTPTHLALSASLKINTWHDLNTGSCAGTCSLRDAINLAAPGDTITFDPAIFYMVEYTIPLVYGTLTINKDLTIRGPYPLVVIDGQNTVTPLTISSGTVNISNLLIERGNNTGGPGGGDIYQSRGATLNISHSWIYNGSASKGGGIFDDGGAALTISDTFFYQNTVVV